MKKSDKKRIAVITSTRAEYGLLYPLLKESLQDPLTDLQLLVSGTHLLKKYGYTMQDIRRDHIPVAGEIPIYDEDFVSDEVHVTAAAGRAAITCGMLFERERYDAVLVLGDRYELLGFCMAAVLCRIPIIHIHGGELTQGALDDKIRHAVTKMASIHFPSIDRYARRIIQMGEDPARVYPVGALGIDSIMCTKLPDKAELFRELGIHSSLPVAVVTYHPVTGSHMEAAKEEITNVLEALLAAGLFAVITMPNADAGGDIITKEILKYTARYGERMIFHKSLGRRRYLGLMKHADLMAGNSSGGILESASFRLPAVNIGSRQKGRMAPENVIHCPCEKSSIEAALRQGLSRTFRDSLQNCKNPYGDGKAAQRILSVIRETDFTDQTLISKKFYDMEQDVQ